MATSQTFSAQCSAVGSFGYASYFKLYVKLEETDVSTSGNSSKIKYTVYCQSSGSGSINAKHFKYFKLNGTEIKNATESVNVSSPNAYIAIASGTTGAIGHDTDGSKSVSFSAQIKGSSYGVSASLSGTFALTKIARYFSSTPTITLSSKTETTMTYTWKTSETCNGLTWNGGGTMSGFSSGTSGTITISGLSANTSYSHYGTFKRSDSGLTSNSGTSTNSTYNYPYCNSAPNFTIGNNVTIGFYNPLNRNITIQMWSHNSQGFVSDQISASGTSYTGFSNVASRMYQSIPSTNSSKYNIDVYYGSNKAIKEGGYYSIRGDEVPTFNNFDFSAENTYSLTGDYKKIIKGYSTIHAFIDTNNKATPNYYASGISKYVLNTSAGSSEANFSSDSRVDLYSNGNVNTNQVTVYAVDSRGVSKSVTKTGELINYSNVGVYSAYALRENNVGEKVTLGFSAYIWNGNFGAVQNSVQSIGYKYKLTSSNTWTDGATELTYSISGNTLTGSCVIAGDLGADGFNVENSYNIQFYFSDKLSSTAYTITIGSGNPAIAIYKNKVAIGGKYDVNEGSQLQVSGNALINCRKQYNTGTHTPASWYYIGDFELTYQGQYVILNGCYGNGQNGIAEQQILFKLTMMEGWNKNSDSTTDNIGLTVNFEQNYLDTIKFKINQTDAYHCSLYMYMPSSYWNLSYTIDGSLNKFTPINSILSSEPSSTKEATVYTNMYGTFGNPAIDSDGRIWSYRGDLGFSHQHATSNKVISFGVGSGGTNRGIWDSDMNAWIINANSYNDIELRAFERIYFYPGNDSNYRAYFTDTGELWTNGNLWVRKGASEPDLSLSRTDYKSSCRIYAAANNSGSMSFGVESATDKQNPTARVDLYPTNFQPRTGGAVALGASNARWGQIYSTSSSISTSDRNLKKDIEEYTNEYNVLFDNLKPVKFKFKGKEHDRIHTGFISQDVEEALELAGLTAIDFSGFCKDQKKRHEVDYNEDGEEIRNEFIDEVDDDGNPVYEYSLRYEDFISLNTWQIQKLKKEIEELKEEIKNLKNK